jgi:hypothetical protein
MNHGLTRRPLGRHIPVTQIINLRYDTRRLLVGQCARPPQCSAELHSAVSQICNLRRVGPSKALRKCLRTAEYNSAIRQTTSLRYSGLAPPVSDFELRDFQAYD